MATNAEIITLIKSLEAKLDVQIDAHEKRITMLESVVKGNNHEGLSEELSRLDERVELLSNNLAKITEYYDKISEAINEFKIAIATLKSDKEKNITFKWLVEEIFIKYLLPAMISLITALLIIENRLP